jgi:putative transposase
VTKWVKGNVTYHQEAHCQRKIPCGMADWRLAWPVAQPQPLPLLQDRPEIIRLAVMMYIRFPLSLRNVEDLLHERGIDICHETVRFWWHRFGPMFAAEIRRRRVDWRRFSH